MVDLQSGNFIWFGNSRKEGERVVSDDPEFLGLMDFDKIL